MLFSFVLCYLFDFNCYENVIYCTLIPQEGLEFLINFQTFKLSINFQTFTIWLFIIMWQSQKIQISPPSQKLQKYLYAKYMAHTVV